MHRFELVMIAMLDVSARAAEVVKAAVALEHKSAFVEHVDQVGGAAEDLLTICEILVNCLTGQILKCELGNRMSRNEDLMNSWRRHCMFESLM